MEVKIIRKTVKNLILKIRPDGTIEIVAPRRVSEIYIKDFISRKQSWIEKKLTEIKNRQANINHYTEGEKIFYLGKQFDFILKKSDRDYIEKNNETITLFTQFPDDENIKKDLMNCWYREEGKKVFLPILEKFLKLTGKNIEKVTIKTLKSNWGSCNYKKQHINLNGEMMKKDIRFIEYVILHEIAHLEHPNHSKEFYGYIEKFMPDWKERKKL